MANERVRLRLHWGGSLDAVTVPGGTPTCAYVGGEVFNESVPVACSYAELCLQLNDKVGYTTSIKYQAPGEELSPNELVSVTGDDDLQELYDEYFQALRRPGTPIKTFRIRVFLFPALQDELYTDAEARAVEFAAVHDPLARRLAPRGSGGAHEHKADAGSLEDAFNPDDWEAPDGDLTMAGDLDESEWCERDGSTEPSCAPSEMQWAPHTRALDAYAYDQHAGYGDGAHGRVGAHGAGGYGYPAVDPAVERAVGGGGGGGGQDGESYMDQELPPGVPPAFAEPAPRAPLLFTGTGGSPIDRTAISNLLASVTGMGRPRGITEEIGIMDPYHEGDDGSPRAGPGAAGAQRPWPQPNHPWDVGPAGAAPADEPDATAQVRVTGASPGVVAAAGAQPQRSHSGVLGVWGGALGQAARPHPNLPSHISVFGSSDHVHLPSHISVFGSSGSDGADGAGDAPSPSGRRHDPHGDAAGGGGARPGASGGAGVLPFLPSHISAFGDGSGGGSGGAGLDADMADAARGIRGSDGGRGGDGGGGGSPRARARGSTLVTQEFLSPRTSPRAAQRGGDGGGDGGDGGGGGGGASFGGTAFRTEEERFGASPLPGAAADPMLPDTPLASTPKLLDEVVKVPISEVTIIRKIGEGAFGEVSYASVQSHGLVAVKWLKRDRFAKYSESFMREAEVLAKLNHPNIIRMYGVVVEPVQRGSSGRAGPAAAPGSSGSGGGLRTAGSGALRGDGGVELSIAGIMTDYVRGGSLSGQLRAARRRPTPRERCMVAVQAARGMAFLHAQTPAVIHFDLKPDNLLVDGDSECLHVKVADFGLSKHKFQNFVSCRDLRGTLPYMAPELVSNPNQVSEKCDVWSMGVVMWEMYTLEVPYRDMSAQQILMALMQGSIHLRIPSSCEPEWRGLIEMCMDPTPTSRPSFKQLTTHLDSLLRQLSGGVGA